MDTKRIEKLAADNVRLLAAEGVQKAKSGHPGMPMGCADLAFTLWYKFMRHNPVNPEWMVETDLFFQLDTVRCLFIHYSIFLNMD